MQRQSLSGPLTHTHHFVRMDFQVGCLSPLLPAQCRLVDKHAGVRQRKTLTRSTSGQKYSRSRGRLPQAHGLNLGANILHGVIDSGHRGERATGRVNVQGNIPIRVLRFQHQQLRHNIIS